MDVLCKKRILWDSPHCLHVRVVVVVVRSPHTSFLFGTFQSAPPQPFLLGYRAMDDVPTGGGGGGRKSAASNPTPTTDLDLDGAKDDVAALAIDKDASEARTRQHKRKRERPSTTTGPRLVNPGQATLIREATRRRRVKGILKPYSALLGTVRKMREVRRERDVKVGELQKIMQRIIVKLMYLSEDTHFLFHEQDVGGDVESLAAELKELVDVDDDDEEEEEEKHAGVDSEEDEERVVNDDIPEPPGKKRRVTVSEVKSRERVLRHIIAMASDIKLLDEKMVIISTEPEKEYQRQFRTQLETMADMTVALDDSYNKLVTTWSNNRFNSDTRTFVASHVNRTPCMLEFSPFTLYDPPVDFQQATEAATHRPHRTDPSPTSKTVKNKRKNQK